MKVLVVDDNRDNKELLAALMQSQGHAVVQACNGLEALDLARADMPDLIISDVLMPEMDGFTLCRILKSNQALRHIPFVFYTATYLNAEDEALGYALGASRYLLKPMQPRLFVADINQVVEEASRGKLPAGKSPARDDLTLAHTYQQRIVEKLDKKARDVERLSQEQALILAAAGEGIVALDADGYITLANTAAASLLGYVVDEMVGEQSHQLWHHSYADGTPFPQELCPIFGSLQRGEAHHGVIDSWWRKDGTILAVEYSSTPLIEEEKVRGAVVVFRDVSERQRAQARLQLAASVFNHAREGITITDASGTILEVNETFTQITGYSREDAIGKNPRMLQSGRQTPEFFGAMWRDILSVGHWSGEIWNRRKSGEIYAEMLHISAVPDTAGGIQNYVALSTDLTSLKAHQGQLERQAHYDALTGLPNRLLMVDRLRQAMAQCLRRSKSVALVYLDLDNFKDINDRYGYEVGNAVLIEAAQRMGAVLRQGDTLSRMGGDEFVAVIADLDHPQDAIPLVERLLLANATALSLVQARAAIVPEGEHQLVLSASIGVTSYPQDNVDADVLLRHADIAMYAAKQDGRNRYRIFDLAQEAKVQTQHVKLAEFRRALDDREFVLYYQPKVNLRTRHIIGAEALIRWQHPSRGLLMPGDFLPDVENQPISVELGEWVIEAALEQMALWRAMGFDMPVSVNVSAHQFQSENFVDRLRSLLSKQPLVPPGDLDLEVLETSAMQNIAVVSAVMRGVQELGVHISLDDFGTGYSSLIYLRHLPAEVLKIDQSFIREMLTSTGDLAIVKGVIGLAESFGRQVIAEGVETAAIGAALLALGCEQAQGYGIARPMPANDFPGWAQAWRKEPVWTAQ